MKQVFGLASIIVLFTLYKAYQVGEVSGNLTGGIKLVVLSWVPYVIVLIAYLILAKAQEGYNKGFSASFMAASFLGI
jgi:hypothetical protein